MRDTLKILAEMLKNKSGKQDFSDRVISLIVAAVLLFSLFGTMYASFLTGNATLTSGCPPYYNSSSPCPSSHIALYGIIMTLLVVGFVIMIWKAAKGGR